jgi:hypothetical protein
VLGCVRLGITYMCGRQRGRLTGQRPAR